MASGTAYKPQPRLQALVRCAERELRRRQRVYPVRIQSRRMNPETAAWEIAAMAEIAARLRELAQAEQLV